MKKKCHLRLVETQKKVRATEKFERTLRDICDDFFVSRREKIYVLKDIITRIYRDYEITTGINDIPYFIRAENKIKNIIAQGDVDYYYRTLKRCRRDENFKIRQVR